MSLSDTIASLRFTQNNITFSKLRIVAVALFTSNSTRQKLLQDVVIGNGGFFAFALVQLCPSIPWEDTKGWERAGVNLQIDALVYFVTLVWVSDLYGTFLSIVNGNQRKPSFFGTNTIDAMYSMLAGLMTSFPRNHVASSLCEVAHHWLRSV